VAGRSEGRQQGFEEIDLGGGLCLRHPERHAAMLKLWDEYSRSNGVIVSDAGPFAKREP
jgi:hypothetical protein